MYPDISVVEALLTLDVYIYYVRIAGCNFSQNVKSIDKVKIERLNDSLNKVYMSHEGLVLEI